MKKNTSEFLANFVLLILISITVFCFLGPLILALVLKPAWFCLYGVTIPLILYVGKRIEQRDSVIPHQSSPELYEISVDVAKGEDQTGHFRIADDPGFIPDDTILHIN